MSEAENTIAGAVLSDDETVIEYQGREYYATSDSTPTPETYPQTSGEYTIIGPNCMKLGDVINYEGENFYTIEQARAIIAAETPAKLTDYKQGEQVEVLDPKAGVWREGFISSIDRISNHLHVDTERGPITVASTGRIRRRSVSASDE